MEEKVCRHCGQYKPLDEFSPSKNGALGRDSYCKKCRAEMQQQHKKKAKEKRIGGCDPTKFFDPRFEGCTPNDLIQELKARGYTGELTYTEVKIHKIKL